MDFFLGPSLIPFRLFFPARLSCPRLKPLSLAIASNSSRRIAELDAKYTVAQPKRSGFRVVALILLALIAVAAFSIANRTSSDFVQLTLKQGPVPVILGAAATGLKRGE